MKEKMKLTIAIEKHSKLIKSLLYLLLMLSNELKMTAAIF